MSAIIDENGFRLNVGMILLNSEHKLFWGRRINNPNAWQFPQGGIQPDEEPVMAMYRELKEELGLEKQDVDCVAESKSWLSYDLPKEFRRYGKKPLCVGQRQKWFLLRLVSPDSRIRLAQAEKPEFDAWRWVDYWYPLEEIVAFKRDVYQKALEEFEELIR